MCKKYCMVTMSKHYVQCLTQFENLFVFGVCTCYIPEARKCVPFFSLTDTTSITCNTLNF